MVISKFDYERAFNAYEIEAAAMGMVERKMTTEIAAKSNYITQQSSFTTIRANVRTQGLTPLRAQLEYQRPMDELASVS